jgi:hypothetical protein
VRVASASEKTAHPYEEDGDGGQQDGQPARYRRNLHHHNIPHVSQVMSCTPRILP